MIGGLLLCRYGFKHPLTPYLVDLVLRCCTYNDVTRPDDDEHGTLTAEAEAGGHQPEPFPTRAPGQRRRGGRRRRKRRRFRGHELGIRPDILRGGRGRGR